MTELGEYVTVWTTAGNGWIIDIEACEQNGLWDHPRGESARDAILAVRKAIDAYALLIDDHGSPVMIEATAVVAFRYLRKQREMRAGRPVPPPMLGEGAAR
jgi:hypothetical protein